MQDCLRFNSEYDEIWNAGAVARITCLAVDKKTGYELAPFSILSKETDEKGYFFATFSGSEIEDDRKLTQCKAFLNSSPWESCNVPTNVNDGMSGALLVSYRLINNKRMKLHSVGPFIYTTEPKATPSGNWDTWLRLRSSSNPLLLFLYCLINYCFSLWLEFVSGIIKFHDDISLSYYIQTKSIMFYLVVL